MSTCKSPTLSEFFLSPRPTTKSQDLCTFSLNAVNESSFIILQSVDVWWEYVSINPGTSFNPDTGNRVYAGFPHISPLCPNHDFANEKLALTGCYLLSRTQHQGLMIATEYNLQETFTLAQKPFIPKRAQTQLMMPGDAQGASQTVSQVNLRRW